MLIFQEILQYCCKFDNFIVLHHDLSFQTAKSSFLFKTQNDVLQMCASTFNILRKITKIMHFELMLTWVPRDSIGLISKLTF